MKSKQVEIDQQIQLWALCGPLLAVATLLIILLKGANYTQLLSSMLLVGSLLCWKWRVKGFAATLTLVIATTAYLFPQVPSSVHLWLLGLSAAISLTCLIITLSYAEIEQVIKGMQLESASRLQSLLHLDEKLDQAHSRVQEERTVAAQHQANTERCERLLQVVNGELEEVKEHRQRLMDEVSRLMTLAESAPQEEVIAPNCNLQEENDFLQRECNHAKAQCRELEEQLESLADLERERNSARGMYSQLREQFSDKQSVLDETRRSLFEVKEQLGRTERESDQKRFEITELEESLQKHLVETEKEHMQQLQVAEREIQRLYQLVNDLMTSKSP